MAFDKCIVSSIHQNSTIRNNFTALKILGVSPFQCLLIAKPMANHWSVCFLYSFTFSRMPYKWNLQYIVFLDWHLLLGDINLRCIDAIVWIYSILSHPLFHLNLSGFQFLHLIPCQFEIHFAMFEDRNLNFPPNSELIL